MDQNLMLFYNTTKRGAADAFEGWTVFDPRKRCLPPWTKSWPACALVLQPELTCFVCERTFASTVRSSCCGCSLGLLWVSPRVRLLACAQAVVHERTGHVRE